MPICPPTGLTIVLYKVSLWIQILWIFNACPSQVVNFPVCPHSVNNCQRRFHALHQPIIHCWLRVQTQKHQGSVHWAQLRRTQFVKYKPNTHRPPINIRFLPFLLPTSGQAAQPNGIRRFLAKRQRQLHNHLMILWLCKSIRHPPHNHPSRHVTAKGTRPSPGEPFEWKRVELGVANHRSWSSTGNYNNSLRPRNIIWPQGHSQNEQDDWLAGARGTLSRTGILWNRIGSKPTFELNCVRQ